MNKEEYITTRVDTQIDWYDRKSNNSKSWFKWLRGIEFVAAAAIPLIAGFAKNPFPGTLVVAFLGAVIAIIAAIISLNKFQENWIEYRTACELLNHEKFLYLTEAKPYHEKDSFHLFVQRVESLISKEHSSWTQYTNTASQDSKTGVVKE